MDVKGVVKEFVPRIDSLERVYDLFRKLGYHKDKVLDPTYKRKISEFEFAKEESEKVKDIYTVFNYDGKLQIFLIETKTLSVPLVKYLTKHLSDRYLRFLLILTADYKEYTFVFPEFERIEEGRHKLKLTRLNFNREQPYYTDLLTITNIALTGDEENWRDIWKRWKDAFSVEKVTDQFFEDYKNAFFELRNTFEKQKIAVKDAHELSQQFLNRLMFLYFLSKKRWLNSNPKFIKWYWERYKEEKRKNKAKDNTFYESWLRILFLEAFNNKYSHPPYHPQDVKRILAAAPYLNGGLFQRNDLDNLPFYVSDALFEKVFSFFEKYNFTIREDLPLDIEVAVDPQMIGYVYESLSNVAEEIYERQDLGIFYTPTVEVDFMCRRSMVEYLTNHLASPFHSFPPVKGGAILQPSPLAGEGEGEGYHMPKEWIYRLLFDEDKKAVAEHISKHNLWYRLEEVLDNLAVVDPACGSGAFLVGMLHVLTELYRLTYNHIKREMTEFELKKKIIGNSLYGVDVMPWAVHSAELRLWLQLIIEEDIPYEQRKLFPLLPNLNLRLRVGDSLVQEIGGINLHIRDSRLSPAIKRRLTSLKAEKEKYYNNDPTAKFKSDKSLLQEELRIFGEILEDKIITLQKEIQSLEGEKRRLQIEMFKDSEKESEKQKNLFEKQIKTKEEEIQNLNDTMRKILVPEQKPFVWDIDFAEIFGDKGGFDIVIGNPPYVRQEKIAPPNKLKAEVTLEGKREYKDKLLSSIQVHYPFVKKLDKKSDYYIYFYFHGLSLLNDKGTFCFITSNSWLDVGYGKDLQEFLLKYCHVKAIYDNEAKRSFEHADVNTIIAIFGAPDVRKAAVWPALKETTRYVMLKKPFEEAINTKNLLAIENAEEIQKTESYRVYPVNQETLLEEGWEYPEEDEEIGGKKQKAKTLLKEKFSTGKYEGNKWGGKYLRAPDIFFTILEKGKGKLVKLNTVLDVKAGCYSGINEFFYISKEKIDDLKLEKKYLVKLFKSPQESDMIELDTNKLNKYVLICRDKLNEIRLSAPNTFKYIKWGENQKTKAKGKVKADIPWPKVPTVASRKPGWYSIRDIKSTNIFLIYGINDRYIFWYSPEKIISDRRLHMGYVTNGYDARIVTLLLNCTLSPLFIEIEGRVNLGEGALDFATQDANNIFIVNPSSIDKNILKTNISNRPIRPIFEECGINPARPVREQKPNPHPDRKALDDIVFDILGLTEEERNEVYWAVCELVKNRLEKARSV